MRTGIPQLLPLVPGENREDEDRNTCLSSTTIALSRFHFDDCAKKEQVPIPYMVKYMIGELNFIKSSKMFKTQSKLIINALVESILITKTADFFAKIGCTLLKML